MNGSLINLNSSTNIWANNPSEPNNFNQLGIEDYVELNPTRNHPSSSGTQRGGLNDLPDSSNYLANNVFFGITELNFV